MQSRWPQRSRVVDFCSSPGPQPRFPRPSFASALDYPTRPVRIIAGFPPGGSNDLYARLIAQWLSERHGQQFFVENRPAAGGTIGTEAVTKAKWGKVIRAANIKAE